MFPKFSDYNDAPSENDEVILIGRQKQQNPDMGASSKAAGKRKQVLILLERGFFKNSEEFPSAKELKDSSDCHWVVAHVTPPSWKQHLKEISLEKLYDIHDKAYMRQAVLDNMLNNRIRKLMSTLSKNNLLVLDMRFEIKTFQGQVDGLHSEYSRLVLEEKKWVKYEQTLSIILLKGQGLEPEIEKLKSSETHLLQEIDSLKQDRVAVVCAALKDVANLKEPFALEKMPGYLTANPYASVEQLLSKKPQSLCSKPAPSHSKPSSLKAPII
ncbi:hypothetical protein Tco_0620841 [Tanacetum coccineum]